MREAEDGLIRVENDKGEKASFVISPAPVRLTDEDLWVVKFFRDGGAVDDSNVISKPLPRTSAVARIEEYAIKNGWRSIGGETDLDR